LKTRPKQLLGSLPLDIALPALAYCGPFKIYSYRKFYNISSWSAP